ncbi:MAG: hypothetical protein IJ060_07210 [Oscillospiraceae bacterium]|nr:hypothetical protein [Oscillospiraceae bacterium]
MNSVETMSGRQTVLMDQRGRISFPAAFRAVIGDSLFISPAENDREMLVVRSLAGFNAECDRIREEFRGRGFDEEDVNDEVRDFSSMTQMVSPDKNGRITVDGDLIKYAKLKGRVVVVGMQSFAELWDEGKLLEHEEKRKQLRQLRRRQKEAEKAARLAGKETE